MHFLEQSFWIRDKIGVPRPSCPSATACRHAAFAAVPVPVHVQNHYVGGDIVGLKVVHNFAVVIGGVRGIFAVPVSENVGRRQRYFACYPGEIVQSLLVVIAIAEEIEIDCMWIFTVRPPVVAEGLVRLQSERTTAVYSCRSP